MPTTDSARRPSSELAYDTAASRGGRAPAAVVAALALAWALPQVALAQGGIRSSGDVETEGRLISTAPSGPPLAVVSDEVVDNLNADLLDGFDAADFVTAAAHAAAVAALEAQVADLEALVVRLHPRVDLENSRFRATVTFDDGTEPQPAGTVALGPTSAYFFFTRDFYADVFLRLFDARSFNGHWWVFTAPLSDLGYVLRIEDVETGLVRTYVKPSGSLPTLVDTMAFPDSFGYAALVAPAAGAATEAAAPAAAAREVPRVTASALASCVEDADTVCLVGNRYAVEVVWSLGAGGGAGQRSSDLATGYTGAFWFTTPSSLEIVVKIQVTPAVNVVHVAAVTNADYTVTVTDTCTGTVKTYENANPATTNYIDDVNFQNLPCAP